MSESTLAGLIDEFDLRRRLDATRQGELEETTRVLLEVRQRHPGLELAFRVEEAMRFTRDTWSIDDQEGAGRPALSARLVPLLESSSSDEATLALCDEGRKHAGAELPSRLEAMEAFERAATPKIRMWLALLRAAALARGPVTFRERCVRGDGRLAWRSEAAPFSRPSGAHRWCWTRSCGSPTSASTPSTRRSVGSPATCKSWPLS